MKLLTKEIKKMLPALYATEAVPLADKVVVCKFFDPTSGYTFYCVEGQEEEDDFILWGCVTGLYEDEFGYTSLKELESVRLPFGLRIERDLHWRPRKVSEIEALKKFW